MKSIVTVYSYVLFHHQGLFPSHTGIVANNFRDEKLNDSFRIKGPTISDSKWWKGEPVGSLLV